LSISLCPVLFATELYVDNVKGGDNNPGTRERPFRSFRKSLEALKGGDTLHIVPNEKPYREEFGELSKKHSGTPEQPTLVDGHDAHLTRLNHFGAERWKSEGNDVFSLRFKHNVVVMSGKGYYDGFPFVFVDGKPLPCVKKRDDLTANSCFFFLLWDKKLKGLHPDHGMLYIKLAPGKTPADVRIMAPETNGVIVGGDYITVKNINAKWSSSDLFDTHRGQGIVFENINVSDCMDQCISAHSTAGCVVRYSFFRNALAQCVLDITFRPEEDCRMLYNGCIFERGGAGFQGGGHYVVENCIMRDNTRNALMARGNAELKVKNCIMVKGADGRYGISIGGKAKVEMENCTFIGFDYGVCIWSKAAELTLKNCVFIDCGQDVLLVNGATPDRMVSENNVFSTKPVFKIGKQTFKGLEAFRHAWPEVDKGSRELSNGETPVEGCDLTATLTLLELTNIVKNMKP
jgi:hypothetical protein